MCGRCEQREGDDQISRSTAGTAVPPGLLSVTQRDAGAIASVHALERALAWPLIVLVKLYQFMLSPVLGRQCRFYPTCSWYALDALRRYGGVRGGWMTIKRLARCHPFSRGGYDPVV